MLELLIIVVILLVVFGAAKVRSAGSDLGAAVKGFRKSLQAPEQPPPAADSKPDAEFPECWPPERATAASQVPEMMRAPTPRARQRGFFDFSFPELVITFGVALVVLGPKKLPGLVQQVGRWVGRARHMARQFRERLEQEVNSINEVKPVPRHVSPEVGPMAPAAEPAPESSASAAGTDTAPTETATASATPQEPVEPAGNDTHPEGQIYFALNATEPTVVGMDPYMPEPVADDPQALTPPAASHEEHETAPAAAPKPADTSQPATVEVVFPHDHG